MAIATPEYTIREATEEDVPEILSMITSLAAHQGKESRVTATEAQLRETLTFPASPAGHGFARTLLVYPLVPDAIGGGKILPSHRRGILRVPKPPEDDDAPTRRPRPAGMALFFPSYSTWLASPGVYLEDLFVREEYRGKGYGRALLSALARVAREQGGQRLEWGVQEDNKGSIAFYEGSKVNAKRMGDWRVYRVEGEELGKLAESKPGK